MGVTPARVVQTVTQAVKCSRHALSHLNSRVLWWWLHKEEMRRESG